MILIVLVVNLIIITILNWLIEFKLHLIAYLSLILVVIAIAIVIVIANDIFYIYIYHILLGINIRVVYVIDYSVYYSPFITLWSLN